MNRLRTLRGLIRADLRHGTALWDPRWWFWFVALGKTLVYPRLRAVVLFRISHELWSWRAGRVVSLWLQARVLRACGAEIHPAATIGGGFLLVHSSGIVIHPGVVIGRDCALYQGATLGDRDGREGQPQIGDGVRIGAQAIVIGPVVVGDGARIGAGATVLDDVAAGATVVGPKGRVVSRGADAAQRPPTTSA